MKLKVAAKIYPEERGYYEKTIEPLLRESRPWVEFVGEVGGQAKDDFLGNAYALLFPIDWAEPFGLVMIEAMACGTPVIAWPNGSVPEVVDDGVTGFIVDNINDAVRAVARLRSVSRAACRNAFEVRFDARRMARDYLEVYLCAIGNKVEPARQSARDGDRLAFPVVRHFGNGKTSAGSLRQYSLSTVK